MAPRNYAYVWLLEKWRHLLTTIELLSRRYAAAGVRVRARAVRGHYGAAALSAIDLVDEYGLGGN